MLLAMAAECYLKAQWLLCGGKLAVDGRYRGVLAKNEHDLDRLARALTDTYGVPFTEREIDLLGRVSHWIVLGRYPIPKRAREAGATIRKRDGSQRDPWVGDLNADLRELLVTLSAPFGLAAVDSRPRS
jgi:hypothetical protein